MNTEKTASIRSKLVKLFPTNKLLQDSALRQQIKLQNAGKKVKADIIGKDLRETNKIQDLKGQVKNLKSISKTKDRETIDVLKNKNKQISDLEGEIKMMDELAPKLLAQKDEEILNFVSKYKKRKKQALTGIGAAGIAGAGGGYLAGREKNAAKILVDFFKSTK